VETGSHEGSETGAVDVVLAANYGLHEPQKCSHSALARNSGNGGRVAAIIPPK